MLPVFVINLDRRPDRWAMMSEQLDRLGIEATRIPAVDARLLAAQEEWERTTNGNPPFWRINLGAAAGMLGHSEAMNDLLGSDAPAVLILEDDAELASDTPALLDDVVWWPPRGAYHPSGGQQSPFPPPVAFCQPNAIRSCDTTTGTMVWGIGGLHDRPAWRAARVGSVRPIPTTRLTIPLFDLRYSTTARRLHPMQIVPGMARQRIESGTDQQQWRERAELHGSAKRWYRLRRNIGAMPYKARLAALAALGMVRKTPIPYSETPQQEGGC